MNKAISGVCLGGVLVASIVAVSFGVLSNFSDYNSISKQTQDSQDLNSQENTKQNTEVSVATATTDTATTKTAVVGNNRPTKNSTVKINDASSKEIDIDTDASTNTNTNVDNNVDVDTTTNTDDDINTDTGTNIDVNVDINTNIPPYEEPQYDTPQTDLYLAYTTYNSWQPTNEYPYKDTCSGNSYGYPACQCTGYAAWRVLTTHGVLPSNWGNARDWPRAAALNGFVVDANPAVNAIGMISSGFYGHLFWVEKVYSDGSIIVSEYNVNLPARGCHTLGFCSRPISPQEASGYHYIHFDQT